MQSSAPVRIDARDYDILRGWQLVEWCCTHGANEWSLNVMIVDNADNTWLSRFDEATLPYALPNGRRVLNTAALVYLHDLLPSGLFQYRPNDAGWFEDLTLYRNGEPMLEVSSHNGEAYLFVTSDERLGLERAGLPFSVREEGA